MINTFHIITLAQTRRAYIKGNLDLATYDYMARKIRMNVISNAENQQELINKKKLGLSIKKRKNIIKRCKKELKTFKKIHQIKKVRYLKKYLTR